MLTLAEVPYGAPYPIRGMRVTCEMCGWYVECARYDSYYVNLAIGKAFDHQSSEHGSPVLSTE